jgi:hypothetical protein
MPWGDYKTLPCVLVCMSNLLFFKEVVSVTGSLGNVICFLGRHSCAIYTLGNAPGRPNPVHVLVRNRGLNTPAGACFWNHWRFTFFESLFCLTFDIFRDFLFDIGTSIFDGLYDVIVRCWQYMGQARRRKSFTSACFDGMVRFLRLRKYESLRT